MRCWGLTSYRQALAEERQPSVLADSLLADVQAFLEMTANRPDTDPLPWYNGLRLSPAGIVAVLLGELLIHGRDLGRSVGQPWPIPAADARLVIGGLTPILPVLVDPRAARSDGRLRYPGSRWP